MITRSLTSLVVLAVAVLLVGVLAGCPQTPAPAPTATVAVATTAPPATVPATAKPAATTAATAAVSPAATTAAVSPAAATTAAISPAAGTPAAGATASAATVAQGQQLYQADCARCHGPTAEGGIVVGSATSANIRAPDLDNLYHGDVNLIRRAILDGKDQDGEDLDPAMPRWRGTLTDAQANAIIAYLLTLKD